MAILIRYSDNIEGIKINKEVFKICQLDDDTTLFVKNLDSVCHAVSILNEFQTHSGLKINLEKSEVVPIGINRLKNIILPKAISKIKLNFGAFKTLGIWFSHDIKESVNLNFTKKVETMEILKNIWSTRKLSLKGKVVVLKTLMLLQVTYLLSVCYCPHYILQKIDKLFLELWWDGKPAKVKRSTIIANYYNGGLKMPDIFAVHTAAKIKWIKKLVSHESIEMRGQ